MMLHNVSYLKLAEVNDLVNIYVTIKFVAENVWQRKVYKVKIVTLVRYKHLCSNVLFRI